MVDIGAQQFGGSRRHIAVAGAVEAVAAETVLAVEFARHGVGVGVLGHGLVEGGVEYADIGQIRENGLRGADAGEVGRVVQRCQRNAGFQGGDHVVGDHYRAAVFFAAVYHAVADGFYMLLQAEGFHFIQQRAYCAGVVVAVGQANGVFFTVFFEGDVGILSGQFFCQAA